MSVRLDYEINMVTEDANGQEILVPDREIDVSTLTVDLNGSPSGLSFTNNGDGHYYCTVTASGKYTLKINGVAQDESTDRYVTADDNLTTQDINGSPVKGDVVVSGGNLVLYNGTTVLHEADIVNDLTTGGTTEPLSAEQGKTLKTAVDGKETADTTILKEADLNSSISTGGSTKGVNAEVLKDQLNPAFANPTYIKNTNTAVQNLDTLDKVIAAIQDQAGLVQYRKIFSETQAAAAAASSTPAALTEWVETSALLVGKVQFYFHKRSNDTKIHHSYSAKLDVADGASLAIVYLLIDGSVYHDFSFITSDSYSEKDDESPISNLANGLHLVQIGCGSVPSGKTLTFKNLVVQVRSN